LPQRPSLAVNSKTGQYLFGISLHLRNHSTSRSPEDCACSTYFSPFTRRSRTESFERYRNTALTALNSCSMLAGSQREQLAALIESSAASAAETLKLEALIDDTDSREAKEIVSAVASPAVAPASPTTPVPSPQSDLAAHSLPSPEPPPPMFEQLPPPRVSEKEPAPVLNKRSAAPCPVILGLLLLLLGLGPLLRPSAGAVATPAPPPPHPFASILSSCV